MVIKETQEHYCENIDLFPVDKFFKYGNGRGKHILIVGEAPAPNGWRKSGKAFYTTEGKILPTGRNLNNLLKPFKLTFDDCAFTELVKCFVGKDRKQLKECGTKCWPIFIKQLENDQFKIMIILGKETLNIFNNNSGLNLEMGKISIATIDNKKYQILPIYHPSPIGPYNQKRNTEIFSTLRMKLLKIL